MKIKRILSATLAAAMLMCCLHPDRICRKRDLHRLLQRLQLHLLGNLLHLPVQGNDGYKKQRGHVHSRANYL